MFFEYALDPAALSNWDRVRYLLGSFGPSNGRFLVEFPRKWRRMVYDALKCPPVEKSRVEERLRRVDARVFVSRAGVAYDGTQPWLDNAVAEHARQPFRAILANETRGEPYILDAATLSDDDPLWAVPSGHMLERDPAVFAAAVRVLLLASTRVAIVDPYFRADKPGNTAALLAFCNVVDASTTSIEVHFATECEPTAKDDVERDSQHVRYFSWCMAHAARVLPAQLPVGRTVRVHGWKERAGGPRFHNRYLLTNIGGIQFGDSIERGATGQHDRVSILDDPSHKLLWSQLVGATPAFDATGAPQDFVGRGGRR